MGVPGLTPLGARQTPAENRPLRYRMSGVLALAGTPFLCAALWAALSPAPARAADSAGPTGSPAPTRTAPPADAPPAVRLPPIRVVGDEWRVDKENVERVLRSAAAELVPLAGERQLKPIIVSHSNTVPITLNRKGDNGETLIKLATSDTYWNQYVYQFSHELAHVLCNCDRRKDGRNLWFEEALCETASLFVLRRMNGAWTVNPPYPNFKTFAPTFDRYADRMLSDPKRRLPADQTMKAWLAEALPQLEKERQLTDRSKLVAAYLLPLFEDDPGAWEATKRLNLGPRDHEAVFEAYLQGWHERAEGRHKAFVAKVITLFGYDVRR